MSGQEQDVNQRSKGGETVEQLMVDVPCCRPDDPVHTAARLMHLHGCSCLPVIDAERRLLGVVTARSLCLLETDQSLPIEDTLVQDTVLRGLIALKP